MSVLGESWTIGVGGLKSSGRLGRLNLFGKKIMSKYEALRTYKRQKQMKMGDQNLQQELKNTAVQIEELKNQHAREWNMYQQKTIENQQKTIEYQQKTIEYLQKVILAKDAQLEDLNKNRHKDLQEWNMYLQKTIENQQAEIRELKNALHAKEMEMRRNPVYYVSITP